MPRKLTPKQERFVEEYLIDLNASAAARRAGYSERTANEQASRLLAKVSIQEAISEGRRQLSIRCQVTATDVLNELKRIGFSRMDKFTTWGPNGVQLKPSHEIEEDDLAAVAEVTQTVSAGGGSLKIKLHSKIPALHDLGTHLELFKTKHEISGPDGGPVKVEGKVGLPTAEELTLWALEGERFERELAAAHDPAANGVAAP